MRTIIACVATALALWGAGAPASAAAGPRVLLDEGHGQRFLAGRSGQLDLSGLAALFREAGMEVRTSSGRFSLEALQGVEALVISGPFVPLEPDEVKAVLTFVVGGGRLALMLHVGQPLQGLLEALGIQYSRGPVHETAGLIGGRDLDFSVTRFAPHPVTDGLGSLSVFGCWSLRSANPDVKVIARTGEEAWLDSDGDGRRSPGEPVGSHGLVLAAGLGGGGYVVFGDDAIFQNSFLEAHNRDLGRRLARWLAGAPAPPAPPSKRPAGVKL